jgi:hypothetical protein
VISLPQLLERRSDELPLGPFDAQHRGHLVGDREPREGPAVVLTVLAQTAVVELDGMRHLARLGWAAVLGRTIAARRSAAGERRSHRDWREDRRLAAFVSWHALPCFRRTPSVF